MSRERNELLMESGMESIQKGYIYISALLFQIHKIKKKKKKKWDSGTGTTLTGTGTTLAKRGSRHSVPVPHLLVPIPLGGFWTN